MSETGPPPLPPARPPPPSQLGGCGTALMAVLGAILLLPGLCAILFMIGASKTGGIDRMLGGPIVFGLLLGAIGVLLIYTAITSQKR